MLKPPRVLFVVPPLKWSLRRDCTAGPHSPHVGIACMAGVLQRRGIEVKVLDLMALPMSNRKFAEELKAFEPNFIGFTAPTHQIFDAAELASLAKQVLPHSKTIVGGYHANGLPVRTMKEFPAFDYLIYGEGELTFIELIQSDECPSDLEKIEGLVFRDGEEIKKNPPRANLPDLELLDFPAYELFPIETGRYLAYYTKDRRIRELPIFLSRGCPYDCAFCFRSMGRQYRIRSPESLVEEVERNLRLFNCQQLLFTDETFTINKKAVEAFCLAFRASGLHRRVRWICETRVDCVTRELLQLMKEANCCYISYGIESGNQKILDDQKKGLNLEQVREVVAETKKLGIGVQTNFILGHPGETWETAQDTISFAASLPSDSATFGIMVPFPGTEIWEMANRGEAGLRILTFDWRKYGTQIGAALELDTLPRPMLERLQTTAYVRYMLSRKQLKSAHSMANLKALIPYFYNQLANWLEWQTRRINPTARLYQSEA